MTKHISGSLGQYLKMVLHIREQEREITAVMIMGHDPSRDAPEPLNAVGIRIIGRGRDQTQVLLQLGQHTAHEQGPGGRVCLEMSAITMATRPRRLERATAARTCSQNTSAVRPDATRPSNQPSRQSTRPKP